MVAITCNAKHDVILRLTNYKVMEYTQFMYIKNAVGGCMLFMFISSLKDFISFYC